MVPYPDIFTVDCTLGALSGDHAGPWSGVVVVTELTRGTCDTNGVYNIIYKQHITCSYIKIFQPFHDVNNYNATTEGVIFFYQKVICIFCKYFRNHHNQLTYLPYHLYILQLSNFIIFSLYIIHCHYHMLLHFFVNYDRYILLNIYCPFQKLPRKHIKCYATMIKHTVYTNLALYRIDTMYNTIEYKRLFHIS